MCVRCSPIYVDDGQRLVNGSTNPFTSSFVRPIIHGKRLRELIQLSLLNQMQRWFALRLGRTYQMVVVWNKRAYVIFCVVGRGETKEFELRKPCFVCSEFSLRQGGKRSPREQWTTARFTSKRERFDYLSRFVLSTHHMI